MIIRGVITQLVPDSRRVIDIDTGLTLDGKTGWNVLAMRVLFPGINTFPLLADPHATLVCSTVTTATTPDSPDEIFRVDWAQNGSTASTAALYAERQKEIFAIEPRLTVQPVLRIALESGGTGVVSTMFFQLQVEIQKLSDLEVMRLYAGGA